MAEVVTSRDGGVPTITLNRPEVFNAFNAATARGARRGARRGGRPGGARGRDHRRRPRLLRRPGPDASSSELERTSASASRRPTTRTSARSARSRSP